LRAILQLYDKSVQVLRPADVGSHSSTGRDDRPR
jgi:hypothetical protein